MAEAAAVPNWRLFLGLWPAAEVRAGIEANAAAWHWPPGARRTRPERLHATLHFLGDVPAARVDELREALDLGWEGCTLELDAGEVWPGGIVVLEASRVPPALAELHARLGEALHELGLPVEGRRYRPHVTLARKGQGARPPAFTPIRWPLAGPYLLVRSLPGGGGYQPIQALG